LRRTLLQPQSICNRDIRNVLIFLHLHPNAEGSPILNPKSIVLTPKLTVVSLFSANALMYRKV
jgi:hypothetical protein